MIHKKYYGDLADMATQQLLAPILFSLVSPTAFAVGDLFIFNNTLYKATATISVGDAISIGTGAGDNAVEANTLAEELSEPVINNASKLLSSSVAITPTLPSGITNVGNRTFYYKVGTRVTVSIAAEKASGTFSNTNLFTLPIGYRPKEHVLCSAIQDNNNGNAFIKVFTDGQVNLTSADNGTFGLISFDAFS